MPRRANNAATLPSTSALPSSMTTLSSMVLRHERARMRTKEPSQKTPARLFDFISKEHNWDDKTIPHTSRSSDNTSTPVSMGGSIPIAPITQHPAAVPLPLILKGHSRPSTIEVAVPEYRRHKRPHRRKTVDVAAGASPCVSSSSSSSASDHHHPVVEFEGRKRIRSGEALKRHQANEAARRTRLRQSFARLRDCFPPDYESRANPALANCQVLILEEAIAMVRGLAGEREALRREWEDLIMTPAEEQPN